MAPFLKSLGLVDLQIGFALALQQIIMTVLSSWSELVAETREREHPGRGRAQVLATGIIYGTLCYMLFALPFEWSSCYIVVTGLYTVGLTFVFPVLEAITADFLSHSSSEADLGWERFFGAVWWAISNLYMSLALDVYGFDCTYQMAACAAFTVLVTLFIFTITTEPLHEGEEDQQVKKCVGVDLEKSRSFHREQNERREGDNDSHSVACTATTASATTHQDSEMNPNSTHGSDMSSVTERFDVGDDNLINPNSTHGSDVSSVTERSVDGDEKLDLGMDDSFKSNDDDGQLSCSVELRGNQSANNSKHVSSATHTPSTDIKVEINTCGALTKFEARESKGNLDGKPNIRILRDIFSSCYGSAFMLVYLCLSVGQSVVDNLIFLYFESALKATYLLMGSTIVITILVEIGVSPLVPKLVSRIEQVLTVANNLFHI